MSDIDEQIDEQIDNILNQAVRKARATDTTKWYFNSDWHKEQIKALVAQQVKEARINELERLLRPFLNKRVYGVNAELTINAHNRIATLKGDDK